MARRCRLKLDDAQPGGPRTGSSSRAGSSHHARMRTGGPQTIGIDIPEASLDCHAYPTSAERQFANTAKDHKALII